MSNPISSAFRNRLLSASKAALIHLSSSVVVAGLAAVLVFGLWYPFPYREFSGGRELFLLIISVDVVCGPVLTLVLFNPTKSRSELIRDLTLVVLVQLAALGYGVWTLWQARPLFLVQEVDRFKVIMAPVLDPQAVQNLTDSMRPGIFTGPLTVAIRDPIDRDERNKITFESVQGGRDYAERPEFYLPYQGAAALKSLVRAKTLAEFLKKYPDQAADAEKIASKEGKTIDQLLYLPVIARQDWIAVLDTQARVIGFLKGDGF